MSMKMIARAFRRIVKMFAIGSVAAAPSAAGPADPPDAVRHELAWSAVRDQLSRSTSGEPIPPNLQRIIEQEIEKAIELRVAYTYREVAPEGLIQLDTLWMDHLVDRGATAEDIDHFLAARAESLATRAKERPGKPETTQDNLDILREFNRAPYTSS